MRIYRIVQTIGNTIAGGVKGGLFKDAKTEILLLVNSPDNPPISRGIIMLIINGLSFIK